MDSRDADLLTLAAIRRLLMWILGMGIIGTAVELLLLGHFDGASQLAPLVLLGFSAFPLVWHISRPGLHTVRLLQATMGGFVLAGLVGIAWHFQGNIEFARELYPSMTGMELLGKTLGGATPVFAPGALVLLGLVGLAHVYRHPQSSSGRSAAQEEKLR